MSDIGPRYYDFDGDPITLEEWTLLFGARRDDLVRWRVGNTKVADDIEVSTVWMGLDHNHTRQGPPLIFETMVFGGDLDGEVGRYTTKEQALEGHYKVVERCRKALKAKVKNGAAI